MTSASERPLAGLVARLLGHGAARLRESRAPADLQHRIRLLGVTSKARWTDPHWPGHRY
ncbi:hypothetical protein [Streptomyces sp. SCL15-6]|uniref:hypothetical protein n=1 Tax=Streptomyces sp. SCL15-6 TaxID=2967222 RepID=UPI0029677610|nr:hypothetical protein [Streptomyces sp. SCL15-6]